MLRREGDKEVTEPYYDEAKFFTESRLLQREIKVLLESKSEFKSSFNSFEDQGIHL